MKKIFFIPFLLVSFLFSQEFYAVVKPVEQYNIKSAVSGKIITVNRKLEGKFVKNNTIIQIDDTLDKINLKQTQDKLNYLKEILEINQKTLTNFNKVSSKSQFDKDNQKIKILNLQATISDLNFKIATLKDTISKKQININNKYLYNLVAQQGDWVNPGSLLCSVDDISKGKIEIFLPIDSVNRYKNKTIYINGKKTNLKIYKIYKIADTQHISSYKCEIILPNITQFSNIVKITFK